MKFRIFVLPLAISLVLLGCSSPNAYKQKDNYLSYGYQGDMTAGISTVNTGFAIFSGDMQIPDTLLENYCLRCAAEKAAEKGYDYIKITKAENYEGKVREEKSMYRGKYKDTLGTYNMYRVWQEDVKTKTRCINFIALRGPLALPDRPSRSGSPTQYSVAEILGQYHGSGYKGKGLKSPDPVDCAWCRKTNTQPKSPEHCDFCGKYLFNTLICPHCGRETTDIRQGLNKCVHCKMQFRFSSCHVCGLEHILKDFRAFNCSFCNERSEPGVDLGRKENFDCPHCGKDLKWPAELAGDYDCASCHKLITIHRCPECQTPHVLDCPKPYTCQSCGAWVRFNQPDDKEYICPHCGKPHPFPEGEAVVGMCLEKNKKVYLVRCLRCESLLINAAPGDILCRTCGTWNGTVFCDTCRKLYRIDPYNPVKPCGHK